MKKLLVFFVLFAFLVVPFSAVAEDEVIEDYRAYYVPWIVHNPPTWWAGINIKNMSEDDHDVYVTYEDEQGHVQKTEMITIPAYENYKWILESTETRSITFECNAKIFITALMGKGDEGITELEVREITNLKN